MKKETVIKKLVAAGHGLPRAIAIYNYLSANGFYEVNKEDLKPYL